VKALSVGKKLGKELGRQWLSCSPRVMSLALREVANMSYPSLSTIN
jgi:hypothetical protein